MTPMFWPLIAGSCGFSILIIGTYLQIVHPKRPNGFWTMIIGSFILYMSLITATLLKIV